MVDGALGAKLTDARVARLLTYAGPNLRSLAIRDASVEFTGGGLCSHLTNTNNSTQSPPLLGDADGDGEIGDHQLGDAFCSKLVDLDMRHCPGLRPRRVLDFLRRILSRPKASRLVGRCRVTYQIHVESARI